MTLTSTCTPRLVLLSRTAPQCWGRLQSSGKSAPFRSRTACTPTLASAKRCVGAARMAKTHAPQPSATTPARFVGAVYFKRYIYVRLYITVYSCNVHITVISPARVAKCEVYELVACRHIPLAYVHAKPGPKGFSLLV